MNSKSPAICTFTTVSNKINENFSLNSRTWFTLEDTDFHIETFMNKKKIERNSIAYIKWPKTYFYHEICTSFFSICFRIFCIRSISTFFFVMCSLVLVISVSWLQLFAELLKLLLVARHYFYIRNGSISYTSHVKDRTFNFRRFHVIHWHTLFVRLF